MKKALNQRTSPHLSYQEFLNLARRLGCIGVEVRNDLGRPIFDGISPAEAGRMASDQGLQLLGVCEIYPFNDWCEERKSAVAQLIKVAQDSGARSISLIPRVDGQGMESGARQETLKKVLAEIVPMLRSAQVTGLVEPIGFSTSSLSIQAEVVNAIDTLKAKDVLAILHDTFQFTLARDHTIMTPYIGMVHISGLPNVKELNDQHDNERVLVDETDSLGNIKQINSLLAQGYKGTFSFECTTEIVQKSPNLEAEIARSFHYLESHITDF